MKQVNMDHYTFSSYESPERFTSYYYQVSTTLRLTPQSILEVGVGSGVFSAIMRQQNVDVVTVDFDIDLNPSVGGSVLQLPLHDQSVDVSTAFQILEHLPFEHFHTAVTELARVARKGVILSLPEFGNAALTANIPYVRQLRLSGRALLGCYPRHHFDGQHYWEINKRGYRLGDVIKDMVQNGLTLRESYLNPYNPYHRFFILKKNI